VELEWYHKRRGVIRKVLPSTLWTRSACGVEPGRNKKDEGGMTMDKSRYKVRCARAALAMILCVGLLFAIGCATAEKKSAAGPDVTYEVCSTAQVTSLECFMKESKFSGGPKLHVKLGIKNTASEPKRYRASIFLPDGASSGGFYPRKGKPPVLKPGEVQENTFPMYYDSIPDALTVRVQEL
jgi:hypothetical protein